MLVTLGASWFASPMLRGIIVRTSEVKIIRNPITGTERSARTFDCSVGSEVRLSTSNYISYPSRILSNFHLFARKVKRVHLRLNGRGGQLQSYDPAEGERVHHCMEENGKEDKNSRFSQNS